MLNRRLFLQSGIAAAAIWPSTGNLRAASFDTDPFTLGVASGCPAPDGVVLWTRLIFPQADINMANPFAPVAKSDPGPLDVEWMVAEDEQFLHTVQSGLTRAEPEFGHSVHVQLTGLEPHRWYFYRFRCGNAESPVGRTRTAPATNAALDRFSFAFASCQQYEHGYYSAYRDMAGRDIDLVVHLGDYIYERSYGVNHVREHITGVPSLLYEYRDRYALYKSDPNLQAAHAAFPWLMVWDDHEVINNYVSDHAPDDRQKVNFLKRRQTAYQAWYEHMPVPPQAAPRFDSLRIYGNHGFGQLLDIALLDTRQYRADPVNGVSDGPQPTMLGAEQESWLNQTLKQSRAKWTVIGQQTLLSERDTVAGSETGYNLDGWDGYRAARTGLLDSVRASEITNPIIIGGDLHAFYAADVKTDFQDENSAAIATEFVVGSITSDGPSEDSMATALAENPHLKYGSTQNYGYALMHLDGSQARTEFIAISDRKDPDATARSLQEFAIIDGLPGVNRV